MNQGIAEKEVANRFARRTRSDNDVRRRIRQQAHALANQTFWHFPEPTTVTERVFGWRRSDIDTWLGSPPSSRRY